ncbi:MAG TPA: hypothetical protein VFV31_04335 [Chitinophagaceae bacterium]|nr:hypothetical protein [Chitinophagaceae bacterium]
MRYFQQAACFTSILLLVICIIPQRSIGQTSTQSFSGDSISKDSVILQWMEDLYREDVTVVNDSVKIGRETTRLLKDETYRDFMYPDTYTWEMVVYFIGRQDIKRACWYLLNLYLTDEKNKELVIKSLMAYDQIFKMDKVLTNTFYTYILADKATGTVTDGHFQLTAPHIMDKKLNGLREVLYYLDKYRNAANSTK